MKIEYRNIGGGPWPILKGDKPLTPHPVRYRIVSVSEPRPLTIKERRTAAIVEDLLERGEP